MTDAIFKVRSYYSRGTTSYVDSDLMSYPDCFDIIKQTVIEEDGKDEGTIKFEILCVTSTGKEILEMTCIAHHFV